MMTTDYILAIDQSTSGTKALLVDSNGTIAHKKSASHKQYYPQPGWVEHDPVEIYENVKFLINGIVESAAISTIKLKVLAITNQRETIVVWDKETGLPVRLQRSNGSWII
jgi:glycerol kinase